MILKRRLNIVAKNIRAARLIKGVTQKELSQRTNVSLKAIAKAERTGQIDMKDFMLLMIALNVKALDRMVEAIDFKYEDFPMIDDDGLMLKAVDMIRGNAIKSVRVRHAKD